MFFARIWFNAVMHTNRGQSSAKYLLKVFVSKCRIIELKKSILWLCLSNLIIPYFELFYKVIIFISN